MQRHRGEDIEHRRTEGERQRLPHVLEPDERSAGVTWQLLGGSSRGGGWPGGIGGLGGGCCGGGGCGGGCGELGL